MKKVLFILTMFMMVGLTANAQTCTKTAKKSCAKTCASKAKMAKADADTKVASAMTEAEIAANADENISVRKCEMSGSTSFYQKSVCSQSGSVSWNQVEYCNKSKKFTKVAAASMEKDIETGAVKATSAKKGCSKADKKSCAKTCTKKKSSTK